MWTGHTLGFEVVVWTVDIPEPPWVLRLGCGQNIPWALRLECEQDIPWALRLGCGQNIPWALRLECEQDIPWALRLGCGQRTSPGPLGLKHPLGLEVGVWIGDTLLLLMSVRTSSGSLSCVMDRGHSMVLQVGVWT